MSKNFTSLVLLNTGLAKHNADWNYEKIRSPFARIYYVNRGMATVKVDTCSYSLKPFHIYLLPPFTTHTDECSGEFELYYIHVYENDTTAISIFEKFNFPVETKASSIDLMLIQRLVAINPNRELKKYDPKLYDNTSTLLNTLAINAKTPIADSMETHGILQQLLSRFLRIATPKYIAVDNRILKSLEFINGNIHNKINVKELADICCLSTDHFIRLFKKNTGQTPLNYINQKKIGKAQTLLAFTNTQVKDISYQLLFENVSYFNRLFKKLTGKTPVQYRMMG